MNTLSMSMSPDEVYKTLTKRLHSYFTRCERRYRRGSVNQVIYCFHNTPAAKPPIDIFKFLNDTIL
ncbi:hypothetical protein ANCCAN_17006 [Ancylostoma caninum]|uniref:Uncharacterized protein n=1 Tax=Ancylostoma caninum TaxID=29170 RepID=A0A368G2B8_ANCCA|nr:hypothetical protein ANCCAN_17006 [Ancylostoma caninum]